MCLSKPKITIPEAEPIPETPPTVSNATTKKVAPTMAKSSSAIASKKRRGRGSLRIPLTTSGLSGSGLQFPTT